MGRRTVLLIVAALVAALGSALVFLYVQSADNRAQADQDLVQVLKATSQIDPGETVKAAQAAGKLQMGNVPRNEVLAGAVTSTAGMEGEVALGTIFPKEQIVSGKFGNAGEESALTIPDGDVAISVDLSDTGRVAGFVTPGAKVAVYFTSTSTDAAASVPDGTHLLLPSVMVIAVGDTTIIPTTKTDAAGSSTTEQLPKTLLTLAVDNKDAQKVLYGASHGELSFGLLNGKSKVTPGAPVTANNLFR